MSFHPPDDAAADRVVTGDVLADRRRKRALAGLARLVAAGDWPAAADRYADLQPRFGGHPDLLRYGAEIARGTGDSGEAAARALTALAAPGASAETLAALGKLLLDLRRPKRAREALERAVPEMGGDAAFWRALGRVRRRDGDNAGAAAAFARALDLAPGHPGRLLDLGNALYDSGDVAAATDSYRAAAAARLGNAAAHYNLAQALLIQGDYAGGWREYNWRWKTPGFPGTYRKFPLPAWSGTDFPGRRLLVWTEQGIGDEVMSLSLLPDLLAAGAAPLVECDPRLVPLAARSFPAAEVLARLDRPADLALSPPPDAHLPLLSLAGTFRPDAASFPAHEGYLRPDPEMRRRCRSRYRRGKPLVVGIAWRSRNPATGRRRSIPLADLAAALGGDGVRLVSLQHDADAGEVAAAANATGADLIFESRIDPVADLDAYAAQIAAMDLVVAVDNSAVHVAGALGRPVWILLSRVPDWRWGLAGDASPWYPGARLFRQAEHDDWPPVLAAVRRAFEDWRRNR